MKPQARAISPLRAEKPQRRDSVAERVGFELPVPISEHPDDNMMPGPRRPDEVLGSPEAQTPGRLIRRQHSKETVCEVKCGRST